jgi:hypothetical protein
MATTNFQSGTVIASAWLNGINSAVYGGQIFQSVVTVSSSTQQIYTTPTYVMGSFRLFVFVNGSKQIASVNYTELSSNSIQFVSPLNVNDVIEFVNIGALT